jgi:GxxExxY protein
MAICVICGSKAVDKDQRTYAIIGAAMEVHRELGPGFLEAVYQAAMEMELTLRDIPFHSQPQVTVQYKGRDLDKVYQPDLICFGEIIVELKALSSLSGTEEAQMINYLRAAGLKVGLLLNFGRPSLQYRRFVY